MNVFNQQWKTPPADLKWSEDEIHVWQASLNIPGADLSLLHQFLSHVNSSEKIGSDWFLVNPSENCFA